MRWMVLEERAVLVGRREEDEVEEGWTAAFGRDRRRASVRRGCGLAMMLPALWSGTHDTSSNKQRACLPILTINRDNGGKVCWCGAAEGKARSLESGGRGRASVKLLDPVSRAGCLVLESGRWSSTASGATRRSRCQHAPPGLCTPRISTRSGGEHGGGVASMLPARAVERQAERARGGW